MQESKQEDKSCLPLMKIREICEVYTAPLNGSSESSSHRLLKIVMYFYEKLVV